MRFVFLAELLLIAAPIDTPRFNVENKVLPSFNVENKVSETSYADIYRRVQGGERVEFTAPIKGFPGSPGKYRCYLLSGTPVIEEIGKRVEVPAARPFSIATMQGTTAPYAVGASSSYRAGTAMGRTITLVPMATLGVTENCGPLG